MRLILTTAVLSVLLACGHTPSAPSEHSTTDTIDTIPASPMPEPYDTVAIHILLGKFNPAKEPGYVRIADQYSAGSGRGAYLHKESYEAFMDMAEAAKADGVTLTIISATRNFNRQKAIWEAKWNGQRKVGGRNLAQSVADPAERASLILRYSSMPTTSRHHWGTDFDLNALENSYFASGKGLKEYEWLVANGPEFGFGQPYSAKGPDRPTGYEEEKWHWSYLPAAKRFHQSYMDLVDISMIEGFDGAEAASELDVISNYVNGIAPECLPGIRLGMETATSQRRSKGRKVVFSLLRESLSLRLSPDTQYFL